MTYFASAAGSASHMCSRQPVSQLFSASEFSIIIAAEDFRTPPFNVGIEAQCEAPKPNIRVVSMNFFERLDCHNCLSGHGARCNSSSTVSYIFSAVHNSHFQSSCVVIL